MKNIYILLTGILFIIVGKLHAQRDYYDYAPKERETVYFTDFDSETNLKFFTGKDRTVKGKIKYGQYLFKGLKFALKPQFSIADFVVDTDKDFVIEAMLSANGNDYGLAWGQDKSLERFYSFKVFKRGFSIETEQEELVRAKVKNLVKEWNKLTIRKVGQTYFFFINEKLVYEMPYQPIENVKIGIVTPGWKTFTDYFGVYQLTPKAVQPILKN